MMANRARSMSEMRKADRLGFASMAYFVRWLKRTDGHPPLRRKRLMLDSEYDT